MTSVNSTTWHYNITQVSEVTGLSKQVIRKWEERYQLVEPKRLDNGHRVYTEKDIQILLKVRKLSEQGYSIKQAASVVKTMKPEDQPIETSVPPVHAEMNDFVFLLLEKGAHCDEIEINRILQEAHYALGLPKFLSTVVIPLLLEVGMRWEKREWSEYQEAVITMVIRDYLVQIRRSYQYKEDAPLIMGACLPGEYHEVPLHILLLQAMLLGWKSFLIGSSPAMGAIESLVSKFQPKIVLLSAVTTIPFETYPFLLQQLEDFAATYPSIKFYLGGAGAIEYTKDKKLTRISIAQSIEEVFQ
ncbi:MerR family transcriptional regulator [Lysinibacillus sp. NPDC097195]|uniref:MerR family transcriptional regulator n=1 Tax=Lysinibacillus sp. NPDC097195 TaxID=3364141 RepID=UPI00381DDF00